MRHSVSSAATERLPGRKTGEGDERCMRTRPTFTPPARMTKVDCVLVHSRLIWSASRPAGAQLAATPIHVYACPSTMTTPHHGVTLPCQKRGKAMLSCPSLASLPAQSHVERYGDRTAKGIWWEAGTFMSSVRFIAMVPSQENIATGEC